MPHGSAEHIDTRRTPPKSGPLAARRLDEHSEAELLALVRAGRRDGFAEIMARSNQPLYRVARSIVGDDSEAEDVLQEVYLRAFAAISSFRGEAKLLTWLTQIAVNEARGRLRRRRRFADTIEVEQAPAAGHGAPHSAAPGESGPEVEAARGETRRIIEAAIDALPVAFRTVFVLREVQERTTEETAALLGLTPQTVRTRLFRARMRLRQALGQPLRTSVTEAFPFLGDRCQRFTARLLERQIPGSVRSPEGAANSPENAVAEPNTDRTVPSRPSPHAPGLAAGVTEEMIRDVVHSFYGLIRTDPALGPIFNSHVDDWDHHLAKMCDFWSSVLLLTGRFKGAPVATHAQLPELRATHFARWLHLFRQTTASVRPAEAGALFVSRAEIIAESLQLGIAAARGRMPPAHSNGGPGDQ